MAYKPVAAAKYTCTAGYKLYEPRQNILFCTQGQWVGTTPKCIEIDDDVGYSEVEDDREPDQSCEVRNHL